MYCLLELLILAILGAGIKVIVLDKIKNKGLFYDIAFILGAFFSMAILVIFKINA